MIHFGHFGRFVLLASIVGACGSSSTTPAPTTEPAAAAAPPLGKLVITNDFVGPTKELRALGKAVPIAQIPEVSAALAGLPVSGTADIDIALDIPNGKLELATGHARVSCTKCRIGDDRTKLVVGSKSARTSAFAGEGLEFGHLDLDRLDVEIEAGNGRVEIMRWKVESPDLAVELSGRIELASSPGASRVTGCLRFKPSEALRTTDPKTFAVLSITGAPRGDDGFFSITLEGRIDALKRIGRACP